MANSKNLLELDTELNAMIMAGESMKALDKFYHDDASMGENDQPPTIGKAANIAREKEFFAGVEKVRDFSVMTNGAGDTCSFSQWNMDFDHKVHGTQTFTQVSMRTWKDDKIIKETFYYGGKSDFSQS